MKVIQFTQYHFPNWKFGKILTFSRLRVKIKFFYECLKGKTLHVTFPILFCHRRFSMSHIKQVTWQNSQYSKCLSHTTTKFSLNFFHSYETLHRKIEKLVDPFSLIRTKIHCESDQDYTCNCIWEREKQSHQVYLLLISFELLNVRTLDFLSNFDFLKNGIN